MEVLQFLVNTPLNCEQYIHINKNCISGFDDQKEVPYNTAADDKQILSSSSSSVAA